MVRLAFPVVGWLYRNSIFTHFFHGNADPRFLQENSKYPKSCEFYINKRFVDILIFMDVLGGFAPATVAAPGAISLKRSFNLGRDTRS